MRYCRQSEYRGTVFENKLCKPPVFGFLKLEIKQPGINFISMLDTTYKYDARYIISEVCGYFETDVFTLKSASRSQKSVIPRQLAMHFIKKYTSLTLKQIGALFGGRDHSTVIYANEVVSDRCQTDIFYKRDFDKLNSKFQKVFVVKD